jgi:transcriptional regulator with XRE-family HTH domain
MGTSCLMGSGYREESPLSNPLGQQESDTVRRMTPADEDSLRRRLGAEIRRLRLARSLTLREAAPRCGLSHQMLQQIEKNGQNTTLEKLEGIIRGLRGEITLTLEESALPPEPDLGGIPAARRAIAERFLSVLPVLPEEELDVFVHSIALWERRYGAQHDG